MLVTDKGVRGAGLTKDAEHSLSAAGIEVTVFEDVVADPPSHIVEAAVEACRAGGIDLVLSIGGGSALDTAKLVAYLARTPDRLDDIYGVGLAKGKRLPLLLAPTTAGTGSEVTPIAIVTTPTTEKKGVVSPVLIPNWAILDPELTLGLPPAVTAATGIDAMVHALEAYTSKHRKNPMSDQLARQALGLLSANVRRVCENGRDLEARSQMLLGSMLAGMAFANAPVAAVHAPAYPIGAIFHVPARAVECAGTHPAASLQPAGGRGPLCGTCAHRRPAHGWAVGRPEGAPVRRCDGRDLQGLQGAAVARRRRHRPGDLNKLAEDAMKQTRLLVNNPRQVKFEDALAIYTEAFGNRAAA